MLIKCIKSFRNQLKVGNVYLVVEISIKAANNSVGIRVIDDEGYPAIYEADRFEIVSNRIDDFAILINEDHIVLSHNLILNSELNEKSIEGFWGLFIEDDLKAKQILCEVVSNLAMNENITMPTLT